MTQLINRLSVDLCMHVCATVKSHAVSFCKMIFLSVANVLVAIECAGQVAFQTADMKPIAVLSLQVELQPHTVSQTFRFNHPEHSIMKKSIRIPPLHSLAGQYACHLTKFYFFLIDHFHVLMEVLLWLLC